MLATPSASASGVFHLGGDLPINRLGFGAMRLCGAGVWNYPDDAANAINVLKRCLDLGINFIDTSDAYGPATNEDQIFEALYPYADGLVIATKGGLVRPSAGVWEPLGRPAYLRQCVEMSLRRLGVERIDLWQLHRIDPNVPVEDQIGLMADMQKEGKIRHLGLSQVNVEELKKANSIVPIVSVQNLYNLVDRSSEDVLDYCTEHNIGFIPWFPVASGDLAKPGGPLDHLATDTGHSVAQLALAWLLQKSPVMLPIPGTSSLEHLEENVSAGEITLAPDVVAALDAVKVPTS
jgi:aryl-alcohol dehydrogenase-like predicted oxidoreductase